MTQGEKATTRWAVLEARARVMNRVACKQMRNPDLVWYVVFTLSGKEFMAQKMLRPWVSCVYLPLSTKWRRLNRYKRQKTRIAYPAITGCLFVGFKPGRERWFNIFQSVKSVYGVLGINGRPVPLDGARLADFIRDNRHRFDAPDEEQFMQTHHEFRIGDSVEIINGPFEGHVVDVSSIKGRYAQILVNLLGIEQYVEISLDSLKKTT